MAVLDTFYLLFKSKGADKVKKDQDKMSRSADGLEKNLKSADFTTNQLGDSFRGLGKKLGLVGGAIGLAGTVIAGFKNALSYDQNIEKSSRALNVNAADLDAWGSAVKRNGGTAEGFQNSLKNLSERLYVSGQDAMKVLPQIANNLQKMNRTQSFKYGRTFGLDEGSIIFLRQGSKEVLKAIAHQRELGVVSQKNVEIARDYGRAKSDFAQASRIQFEKIEVTLTPTLTKVLESLAKYISNFDKPNAAMEKVKGMSFSDEVKRFKGLFSSIKTPSAALETADKAKLKLHKVFHLPFSSSSKKIDNIPKNADVIVQAQRSVSEASSRKIASAAPASFMNNEGMGKTINLTTGDINIETQATDSDGIASSVVTSLRNHFRQTVNTFDDGVKI